MSYTRFFAMIATSTVVMFILMYSTVYVLDHVWWSQTKFWMALYMGAAMAVIMLGFMLSMYDDKRKNVAIFVGSAVVFALALFFARSQETVGDVAWMKAMIPHHSIAILTSERAEISDPRARRLADDIILAQRAEIAEMEALIADLEGADYEGGEPLPPSVPPVEGGSEDVAGAPSLTVAEPALRGNVVILDEVKVASDAWVVIHPDAGGRPDVGTMLGRSFVMHGTTARVPVALDVAVEPGATLFATLHDDTGEIGAFEFVGAGSVDAPLVANGIPVSQSFVVN
ncbi:MAG: DUF305 domain-containing protein [Rhodothermales bacterium]